MSVLIRLQWNLSNQADASRNLNFHFCLPKKYNPPLLSTNKDTGIDYKWYSCNCRKLFLCKLPARFTMIDSKSGTEPLLKCFKLAYTIAGYGFCSGKRFGLFLNNHHFNSSPAVYAHFSCHCLPLERRNKGGRTRHKMTWNFADRVGSHYRNETNNIFLNQHIVA